jgi:hypothetical protein
MGILAQSSTADSDPKGNQTSATETAITVIPTMVPLPHHFRLSHLRPRLRLHLSSILMNGSCMGCAVSVCPQPFVQLYALGIGPSIFMTIIAALGLIM